MKSLLATICASVAILSSCTNDTLISSAPDNAISYSVTTGNVSRAASLYGPLALPTEFKVWAVAPESQKPYLDGRTITRSGENSWADSQTQYWPASALNFFAVVNDGGKFKFNNGAPLLENYTTDPNVALQEDVLYATAFNRTSKEPNVALHFNHALAQVGFQAKCTNPNLTVTIKSIKIGNIHNKATFAFPLPEGQTGNWTVSDESTEFTIDLDSPVQIGSDATNLTCANKDNTGYGKTLMLIPQNVEAWNPTETGSTYNGAYFLVDCKIVATSSNTTLREGKIALPASVNWEQGKRYTYTFSFSNHNGGYEPNPDKPKPALIAIGYSVSVSDFAPAGDTDVPIKDQETGNDTSDDADLVGPVFECNGKKFRFSSGNLQYNNTTKAWSLAESQTSCLAKSGSTGVIDLFCWGATGLGDAQKPNVTTGSASDYPSSEHNLFNGTIFSTIYDWGNAYGQSIGKEGYFTPETADWESILSDYYCIGAQISNKNGMLILPYKAAEISVDEIKSEITEAGGEVYDIVRLKEGVKPASNVFYGVYLTTEQLSAINGVFLPTATLNECHYWTSSCMANTTTSRAFNLDISSKLDCGIQKNRNITMAVRLAKTIE